MEDNGRGFSVPNTESEQLFLGLGAVVRNAYFLNGALRRIRPRSVVGRE